MNNSKLHLDRLGLRSGLVNLEHMPREIEVFELGARRLYAKTKGGTFALFEDDLTPEELMAIARDISARKAELNSPAKAESADSVS